MSSIEKLLRQMRNNPRDWRMDDIERIANHYGLQCRKASGSHVTFTHSTLWEILTIPARKPIKPIYIKRLLKMIEELES